jgi:hypothetical protein
MGTFNDGILFPAGQFPDALVDVSGELVQVDDAIGVAIGLSTDGFGECLGERTGGGVCFSD